MPHTTRPIPSRITAVRRPAAMLLALALGLGGFHASAQSQVPPMRGEGAARHVCGGIGSDESTAMRAAMKSHPLSLLFARADGSYLADVGVTIRDAKGATALRLRADGPICLVDLPAGRYGVEAMADGRTQQREVELGRTPATADFRF
jgi:hypothetical protein